MLLFKLAFGRLPQTSPAEFSSTTLTCRLRGAPAEPRPTRGGAATPQAELLRGTGRWGPRDPGRRQPPAVRKWGAATHGRAGTGSGEGGRRAHSLGGRVHARLGAP